ncbi:MAG: hypothetical protein ACXVGH_03245 [Mycobacteriales bacterium]
MGTPSSADRTSDLAARVGTDPLAWDELVARFSLTVRAAVASHWLSPDEQAAVSRRTWEALARHLAEEEGPLGSLGLWLSLTAHAECLKLTSAHARSVSRASSGRVRDRRSSAERRHGRRTGPDRRRTSW